VPNSSGRLPEAGRGPTGVTAASFLLPTQLPARSSLAVVKTGEAMDAVAAQCERRGLTDAATWLSEMSLHAVPSLLATPLPPTSSLTAVVLHAEEEAAVTTTAPSNTALSPYHRRLHRVALGYFTKGEFQRCHQLILREVMRNTGTGQPRNPSTSTGEEEVQVLDVGDAVPPSTLPSPEVVRGFRTTTLPPLLQFLSLYALFMDGMKAKQLSNNANAGSGSGGLQRAVHPHARVLRAYLLEAMLNPINTLAHAAVTPGADTVSPPRRTADAGAFHNDGDMDGQGGDTAISAPPAGPLGGVAADGWDPHTPSTKKQPWTITSASRVPGLMSTTSAAVAAAAASSAAKSSADVSSISSVGSHAFSNFSPATNMRKPPCSPDAVPGPTSPLPGVTTANTANTPAAAAAWSAGLLHIDPYLTWLMGVVLRELRMRQECATYLLAAVTVNPLLRCAWEDLTSLVSRESQLAELDNALEGVEPSFMADIFAAEVRGLLGVTPVSSLRLRAVAASVNAAVAGGKAGETEGGASPASSPGPLSVASPHAINGASDATGERPNGGQVRGSPNHPSAAAAANPTRGPSAAIFTNAWECLNVLFPDTPSLLRQLAHFFYHQRNRLDKAEAIYQRIRKLDPHYYGILYDYSNVLYTKRDRLGLSSLVQSVYHADAFRAETNFAVGNYYVLLGQHDRAALHFHRTTAIDPQCAEAWLLLGHAYVEVKNTTAAVEAYRTAVELNERDYRGWYNLGQIYELLEAYHHALYYYWHTTSLRPADPGMWVAVANCLEHDGRVAESIACLERAETYDVNSSPNYPVYVRRIATHHIANSSFTRACVYLEKLVQSPAATGEDLLLALPFLVQHYVQRARRSMEVSARSASYDPALFSPGIDMSPVSSPASVSAGRTALHHARAAAALQHLHNAEKHLAAMADLVMPAGTTVSGIGEGWQQQQQLSTGNDSEGEAVPMAGMENLTDDDSASGRRRGKQAAAGSASHRGSNTANAAAATPTSNGDELPPVAFVRSRHHEIASLRAQAMQLLHPSTQLQQQQAGGSMSASSSSPATAAAAAQSQQRSYLSAHPVGRH
jgi:anaphase-promoting complex subunit 8